MKHLILALLALLANLVRAEVPEAYSKLWNDPTLTDRIQRNLERNRKGDAVIEVLDAAGEPVANVPVEVRQQSHEFLFGCNLFVLGQLATPEFNRKYEAAFTNLFNFATIPFDWGDLEPEPGKPRYAEGSPHVWRRPPPDRLVNWCREHGITPKGHALLYVKNMFMPPWTTRNDAEALRRQGAAHMAELAARYGRDIPIWDAVNEELPRMRHPKEWPEVPSDFLPWCFREAGRVFPKPVKLLLNDGTSEAHETTAEYEALFKELLRAGVRVEGVGMQFHVYNRPGMLAGKSLPPEQLYDVYGRLGKLGLPLYITEVTVPGNHDDGANLQAAIVENLYRLWFSTPQMAGVTWWNLSDGAAFQEENKMLGGLLDEEQNLKPAYRALDRLINHEWKTSLTLKSDNKGKVMFRGFHGKYAIGVVTETTPREFLFELRSGRATNQATFTLNQPGSAGTLPALPGLEVQSAHLRQGNSPREPDSERGVYSASTTTDPSAPKRSKSRAPVEGDNARLDSGDSHLGLNADWRRCGIVNRCTGPKSPDGMSAVSAVSLRMFVFVRRCASGNEASPMMRLGQKFTTSTARVFVPGRSALEMSTRNGGDQTMPQGLPFTRTSASSRTWPRSRRMGDCRLTIADCGSSNVFS
jgi:GH35 family endo-1,4-beta-xylanase